MPIIAPISRDERRLMQKAIHKTHDKNYARRLTAMLMLPPGRPCQRRCQNALLRPFLCWTLD
ncbi:IS630 transposase [Shigella sonnei]|nr:IS630 transposase [Shigella sonnei]